MYIKLVCNIKKSETFVSTKYWSKSIKIIDVELPDEDDRAKTTNTMEQRLTRNNKNIAHVEYQELFNKYLYKASDCIPRKGVSSKCKRRHLRTLDRFDLRVEIQKIEGHITSNPVTYVLRGS